MPPVEINLVRDAWREKNGVYSIGAAYDANERVDLHSEFEGLSTQEFRNRLSDLNGFFAIIQLDGDIVRIATDKVRSTPLYYSILEDELIISDSSEQMIPTNKLDYNDVSIPQYLLTGYVWGSKTLSPKITQTLPGELITISNSNGYNIKCGNYYSFPSTNSTSIENPLQELESRVIAAFERLADFAAGRPIALALSGGYDSRLCLLMLKKIGYENIVTYTFGTANDVNVQKARDAATRLDVEWNLIQYDQEDWHKWYRTDERKELDRYIGRIAEIPNISNAVGYHKAKKQDSIPDDAVIIYGDAVFTTGEHIPKKYINSPNDRVGEIYDELIGVHHRWDSRLVLETRIEDGLGSSFSKAVGFDLDQQASGVELAERFDWQERQPKFINKSGKLSFYGYDWWSPLWDAEVMDFWSMLPVNKRYNKEIVKEWVIGEYALETELSREKAANSFHGDSSIGLKGEILHLIRDLSAKTPLTDSLAKKIYFGYIKSPPSYQSDPRLGIMDEEFFNELKLGDSYYHGYRILDWLGYVSIENSEINNWPDFVTLPRW